MRKYCNDIYMFKNNFDFDLNILFKQSIYMRCIYLYVIVYTYSLIC